MNITMSFTESQFSSLYLAIIAYHGMTQARLKSPITEPEKILLRKELIELNGVIEKMEVIR